jgi:hypothetical protein
MYAVVVVGGAVGCFSRDVIIGASPRGGGTRARGEIIVPHRRPLRLLRSMPLRHLEPVVVSGKPSANVKVVRSFASSLARTGVVFIATNVVVAEGTKKLRPPRLRR